MKNTECESHKRIALYIARSGWKHWEIWKDTKYRSSALSGKAKAIVMYDRYLNYRT